MFISSRYTFAVPSTPCIRLTLQLVSEKSDKISLIPEVYYVFRRPMRSGLTRRRVLRTSTTPCWQQLNSCTYESSFVHNSSLLLSPSKARKIIHLDVCTLMIWDSPPILTLLLSLRGQPGRIPNSQPPPFGRTQHGLVSRRVIMYMLLLSTL